ncbi:MAG: hypothetical protein ACTSQ8_24235 [Candidatus Helarchaeota archaeon]
MTQSKENSPEMEEFDKKFAVIHKTDGIIDIPFGIHKEYRKIIKQFITDNFIPKSEVKKAKKYMEECKEDVQNRHGTHKYDSCYDHCIHIISRLNQLKK